VYYLGEGEEVMVFVKENRLFYGYLKRFTVTHVFTYLVCGLIFMNLFGYEKEFISNEYFSHFRPLDSPIVQAAVLFQFIRGGMFAVILYPFRDKIVESKYGWLMLFGVIWGMTCIGAVNATPGSIEGFIYTQLDPKAHLIGMPEVIIQALGFSLLLWKWERRADGKHIKKGNLTSGTKAL
jgi:hypothetical protein